MEIGHLTSAQDKSADMILELLTKVVNNKNYETVKANVEGYETPSKITDRKNPEKFFIPDVAATVNGRKSYFELGLKPSSEQTQDLITKWRLLADLAAFKNGKLYIAVPRGNMAFINRMMADHSIVAEVIKL